jgi:integral membrane protein (TIGR01906 family)
MARAPWPVGLAFGVALAVLITLVGPLLLFNPVFTSALQARHGVAAAFDTTQAEVDRVTREVLVDLYLDGPFDGAFEGREPLLDARERSHMHDVAVLVRMLALLVVIAAILAVVTGRLLRHERSRRGRVMLAAAGAIGAVALVLALIFALAFDAAFLAFHAIFFPPDSFLFEPGSNLITLFPQGFWFDASLAAGATIVLGALIVAAIGLRAVRGAPATAGEL